MECCGNGRFRRFVGCVPSYFGYFDSYDKVQLWWETLINIKKQLEDNPSFLTVSELNENSVRQGDWVDLKRFINITQLTIDLIDGQLKTNASSPIDYWNLD